MGGMFNNCDTRVRAMPGVHWIQLWSSLSFMHVFKRHGSFFRVQNVNVFKYFLFREGGVG